MVIERTIINTNRTYTIRWVDGDDRYLTAVNVTDIETVATGRPDTHPTLNPVVDLGQLIAGAAAGDGTRTTRRTYPGYAALPDNASLDPAVFLLVPSSQATSLSSKDSFGGTCFHIIDTSTGKAIGPPLPNTNNGRGAHLFGSYDVAEYSTNYGTTNSNYVEFLQWTLVPVRRAGKDYVRIKNVLSGEFLGVNPSPKSRRATSLANGLLNGLKRFTGQSFGVFELLESGRVTDPLEELQESTLPVPILTEPPPSRTGTSDWVTTNYARLPFFMVEDYRYMTLAAQIQNAPWYYLKRERQYYTVEGSRLTLDTGISRNSEHTIQIGTETSAGQAFETVTSITVTAGAELGFQGVGASLSTTVGQSLSVATTTTHSESRIDRITESFLYQGPGTFQEFAVKSRYSTQDASAEQIGPSVEVFDGTENQAHLRID